MYTSILVTSADVSVRTSIRQHTPGPITAVSQVERQRQARVLAASTSVLAALAGVLNVFADSMRAVQPQPDDELETRR